MSSGLRITFPAAHGDGVCSSPADPEDRTPAAAGSEWAQDEFLLAATARNLGKLARLVPSPGPQMIQEPEKG